MLKGAFALVIRFLLLTAAGALSGIGVVTMTSADHFCMSASAVADVTATGILMLLGGGATTIGTVIWSRIAKRAGGVT